MTRSKSRAEDDDKLKGAPDKVTAKHGGKVVEAISEDELISVHDSECKHKNLVRDPSETEFNAFMCANPNCAVVVLFDKT
jgi:hypothetical protein